MNAFDARIRDFRNNTAPSTAVSMLQQAGGRWEGNVAFNPAKDVIENYGLIELYQTVLNRAADLSINLQPGSSGVNTALLNAANRIASLYTLLGNEAATDAMDSAVGFGTASGRSGTLAPAIFAFQNQTGSLLEEELALLRGRGEVGARPAYNRLLWNFTNGQGEAAYAMNYGITDMTNDGFLMPMTPQSFIRRATATHGATTPWRCAATPPSSAMPTTHGTRAARSIRSTVSSSMWTTWTSTHSPKPPLPAPKPARPSWTSSIVGSSTDSPAGQWQGYQDTNTDRSWGVYESAQRGATGAFFDWVTANALLLSKDETRDGVSRVDRTTVPRLKEIAGNAAAIQSKLDISGIALNPLADADAVPFEHIDPVRTDRTNASPATHFEQVYERALAASQNALRAFDHANQLGQLLRRTAGTAEQLRQQTIGPDRTIKRLHRNPRHSLSGSDRYRQSLIRPATPARTSSSICTPTPLVEVASSAVPVTPADMSINLKGLLKLATDTNPFKAGNQALPDYAKSFVTNWFPADYPTAVQEFGQSPFYTFTVPVKTSGYAFKAPADWGVRASPGKVRPPSPNS